MQNKANFKKAGINVSYYLQKDCENEPRLCRLGKQSQTKPKERQSLDDLLINQVLLYWLLGYFRYEIFT